MINRPAPHYRSQSLRLKHHDYGGLGAYFITICTYKRNHLFGTIRSGIMCLNTGGCLAWDAWYQTASRRPNISLGAFIVMPNHIHGIVHIDEKRSKEHQIAFKGPSHTLGAIVRGYKGQVTRYMRQQRGYSSNTTVWQGNYYEHIIRSPQAYQNIEAYILNNPLNWHKDGFRS